MKKRMGNLLKTVLSGGGRSYNTRSDNLVSGVSKWVHLQLVVTRYLWNVTAENLKVVITFGFTLVAER